MSMMINILLIRQLVETALVLSIFYYSVKATSLMAGWSMLTA